MSDNFCCGQGIAIQEVRADGEVYDYALCKGCGRVMDVTIKGYAPGVARMAALVKEAEARAQHAISSEEQPPSPQQDSRDPKNQMSDNFCCGQGITIKKRQGLGYNTYYAACRKCDQNLDLANEYDGKGMERLYALCKSAEEAMLETENGVAPAKESAPAPQQDSRDLKQDRADSSREIDFLLAIHLFGCTEQHNEKTGLVNILDRAGCAIESVSEEGWYKEWFRFHLPRWSESFIGIKEICEEMQRRGFVYEMRCRTASAYEAEFAKQDGNDGGAARAESLPLAVATAALQAIGALSGKFLFAPGLSTEEKITLLRSSRAILMEKAMQAVKYQVATDTTPPNIDQAVVVTEYKFPADIPGWFALVAAMHHLKSGPTWDGVKKFHVWTTDYMGCWCVESPKVENGAVSFTVRPDSGDSSKKGGV